MNKNKVILRLGNETVLSHATNTHVGIFKLHLMLPSLVQIRYKRFILYNHMHPESATFQVDKVHYASSGCRSKVKTVPTVSIALFPVGPVALLDVGTA